MLQKSATPKDKPRPGRPATVASTRAFYKEHADRYADLTLHLSMAPQLTQFLALCPAGRIVDLGCGAGRDLREFTAVGRDAVGLDLSEALALKARTVSGAPVVVADLRRAPFADGAFAGVWASASLLHLTRGQAAAALGEAARLLQRGGMMFSSVKAGDGERRSKDGRRFVLHTSEAWGQMVEDAGFRLISLEATSGASTSQSAPETWISSLATRL